MAKTKTDMKPFNFNKYIKNNPLLKENESFDTYRYEIIDTNQNEESLNTILDAIKALNDSGLDVNPEDQTGHYAGGYEDINAMYVTSTTPFDQFIRKANEVLFNQGMKHVRIIEA